MTIKQLALDKERAGLFVPAGLHVMTALHGITALHIIAAETDNALV
jgi:hypothetical protein